MRRMKEDKGEKEVVRMRSEYLILAHGRAALLSARK